MNVVSTNFTKRQESALVKELQKRFSLLDRITGQFGLDVPQERIPWFFGLLLAASSVTRPGIVCIVLNKSPGTTAITATLLSLIRFQEDFSELVGEYARTALKPGQLVKVNPEEYVFEYGGIWSEQRPNLFRLTSLSRGEGSRSFPVENVLRLEPTDRRRPMGRLDRAFGDYDQSDLDRILGLATSGNTSLMRNRVLVSMAQSHFAEIANSVVLALKGTEVSRELADMLPWGTITSEGSLQSSDRFQVLGEPLVAVSRFPTDIVKICRSSPENSKVVLVDGAASVFRDPGDFSRIAERQRVIVLASPHEIEALDELRQQGCSVWHMTSTEINIGEAKTIRRPRSSFTGGTIHSSNTMWQAEVEAVRCDDDRLTLAAESLKAADAIISKGETSPNVDNILGKLFGMMLELSESWFGISGGIRDQIAEVDEDIGRNRRWIDSSALNHLRVVLDQFRAISEVGLGESKVDAALESISKTPGKWLVTARSPYTAENLRNGFSAVGADVTVLPIDGVDSSNEYDGVIVPSWPNSRRFAMLLAKAVAPKILVTAYPLEYRWLLGYLTAQGNLQRQLHMDNEERSQLLGIDPDLLPTLEFPETTQTSEEVDPIDSSFDFEKRIARRASRRPYIPAGGSNGEDARFVRYYGGCYSLLTESSQNYVLNELIDSEDYDVDISRTLRSAAELNQGDVLFFRESGTGDFIRALAEQMVGVREYNRVRDVAVSWKGFLRHIGILPELVQDGLREQGLRRSLAAIGGWMYTPDLIGPGNMDDLDVIAKAAGNDDWFLENLDDIKSAITQTRGFHVSAGREVTKVVLRNIQGRLDYLTEQPMSLELAFGQAWVVQVLQIDRATRNVPADLTNKLHWTGQYAFL